MKSKIFILLCLQVLLFLPTINTQNLDIYISDAGNFSNPPWQILKFDQNGENGEVFIPKTSAHLAWPQDILFIEDENEVLISNLNTNVISKFDATTGEFIEEFATGIGSPTRIKLGADSLLYVLQWGGNGKVKRYRLDGTFVDDFTEVGVPNSIGLDWDANGNLYVSSYNGGFVKKFSPTGADLGNFISGNLSGPTNIWFADNGDLFVADWTAGSVKQFSSEGAYVGVFFSGVPQAEGVDFFPNGDLAIGSGGASSVKLYDSDGNFIKDLIPAGTLGLLTPNAVVFREQMTSQTSELFNKDITFVRPSIGMRFQISLPDTENSPVHCSVFASTGELVAKMELPNNDFWNASGLANGAYIVTARLADGTTIRQMVMVQK